VHLLACYLNKIQRVPLATETDISLIILPLMRILQRVQTHTTDTFLFISHKTNVFLFKFRCNIFIGVRIIKEMPGLVASGTHCTKCTLQQRRRVYNIYKSLQCRFRCNIEATSVRTKYIYMLKRVF